MQTQMKGIEHTNGSAWPYNLHMHYDVCASVAHTHIRGTSYHLSGLKEYVRLEMDGPTIAGNKAPFQGRLARCEPQT